MAVKSKTKKKAASKPRKLTQKQELFCRYYTQNRALFGNATHSYAEAYGYDLDKLSRDDAVFEEWTDEQGQPAAETDSGEQLRSSSKRLCG
ncbi:MULTISPECIES: hypothetical protein [unclassified Mesorhizobium]|uniref:hypothetical protein n=1 Tax=unclassified Mesorhizobium TaxID=325217 RepID=UPI000FCA8CCA|nr:MULTISPECIES: hypothetical protein [unclassified Mesorhizobium]RUV40028.1 hypothetical protein EOD29_30010 [Mesorhizobium sp. M1A.T.Ca.IN.004.03.1.1]RWI02627.1 MAG: hypothetical protein EOQ90_33045 [Mesorhizobium sp.]RWK95283.1 MAG: hypothetical protein EOR53_14980 [Mesorhizobium sp.]RWL13378.1 MAG: hypothetical protein EOR57_33135 [Mesorhizobium sp.]TIP40412.1 MAG: hypothetical protein E5X62_28345 [Mesorhizobium sp.]